MTSCCRIAAIGLLVASPFSRAQEKAQPQGKPVDNDIPASFTAPKAAPFEAPKPDFDYIKRVEMVPMRDGVKLYTVIVIPKGAKNAPIVLTRTPYNAAHRAAAARATATGNAVPRRSPAECHGALPAREPRRLPRT